MRASRSRFDRPPASLAAYDCLLRGLAHYRGFGEDDNRKAYEMFERAVALDPQYALAHAYLAAVSLALHGQAAAPPEVLDVAFAAASHALELDPQESYCQNILGLIWLYRRDYDAAEHHYRRALDLNPNDADRRMALAYLLALRGKSEEALGWMQEAMRLNPFHPTWYGVRLGIVAVFPEALRRGRTGTQANTNPRLLVASATCSMLRPTGTHCGGRSAESSDPAGEAGLHNR